MAIDINVPIATNQVSADLTAMANNMKLIVCGEGTAGRVLRLSKLTLTGVNATTIKVKLDTVWNGNDITEETLTTTGTNIDISSLNGLITLKSIGLSSNAIAVLDATIYSNKNTFGYDHSVSGLASSNNILVYLKRDGTGAAIELLADFDSGDSEVIYLTYLTSS
jgi:hypothetical protein